MPALLHIDDEAADARLLGEALEEVRCGATLTWIQDASEAVEGLDRSCIEGWPDLVLLDLNMPKMDGRAFLSRRRGDDRLKQLPVVVLSTSTQLTDVRDSYHLGADGYLVKPLYWTGIVELARQICDFVHRGVPLATPATAQLGLDESFSARQRHAWHHWMHTRALTDDSRVLIDRSRDLLAGIRADGQGRPGGRGRGGDGGRG